MLANRRAATMMAVILAVALVLAVRLTGDRGDRRHSGGTGNVVAEASTSPAATGQAHGSKQCPPAGDAPSAFVSARSLDRAEGSAEGLASSQNLEATVVIFDPNGGSVAGAGWIESPAGAFRPDPSVCGRVFFSLNAFYKPGSARPDGQMEMVFDASQLAFHGVIFDWLAVAGDRAQVKGQGYIPGEDEPYSFLITIIDGQAGGGTDMFHMKVWEGPSDVIYDSDASLDGPFESPGPIAGGSIAIHREAAGRRS